MRLGSKEHLIKATEVTDLSLVAALCCHGATIEAVERNEGPRAIFYIRREKGLDSLIKAFYSHSLLVDPLVYFQCLKEAKTRLYSTIDY
jgi:hypothetical protein